MASAVVLPPVSNREDWDETLQVFDDAGEALDLAAVTAIELIVWDPDTRVNMITGALGSGITIESSNDGTISIHFGADVMGAFSAKNYAFRLGMSNGGAIKDLILPGILPVEDGGP
jgi:hypothetical protein